MTKRFKLAIVSLLLSLGILGVQLIEVDARYQAIGLLAGLAYGLSAWALFEDLKGIEWLTCLILPVLYPVAVALFYFLLPERLLSRMMILSIFGVGMYALLLTENIFNVAASRTIQLLRAAHAVGFLLTLVVAFFLWDTIFSFKLIPNSIKFKSFVFILFEKGITYLFSNSLSFSSNKSILLCFGLNSIL